METEKKSCPLHEEGQPTIDIIVPTCDNYNYLAQMILSFYAYTKQHRPQYFRMIVVNNGAQGGIDNMIATNDYLRALLQDEEYVNFQVIEDEKGGNHGWEGGLRIGLKQSKAPLVLFANDDIHILGNDPEWLNRMADTIYKHPDVGAVGPTSNIVMGSQNVFTVPPLGAFYTRLLIGFCVLVRRDALEKVGGVARDLPGGDDLDLSMRMATHGWKMVMRTDTFVYHHGFKTGNRLYKDYWNSAEQRDKTRMELIRRNGIRPYVAMRNDVNLEKLEE